MPGLHRVALAATLAADASGAGRGRARNMDRREQSELGRTRAASGGEATCFSLLIQIMIIRILMSSLYLSSPNNFKLSLLFEI